VASNGSIGSAVVPPRLPSPEKVGLVEPAGGAGGGGCSDLTLVELRAIVADVWNNKQQDDARWAGLPLAPTSCTHIPLHPQAVRHMYHVDRGPHGTCDMRQQPSGAAVTVTCRVC
jgi:hypothetical protein